MARQRTITCPFCPDEEQSLAIPENWTATYAIVWFHTVHLGDHAEALVAWAGVQALCDRCPGAEEGHRPCFAPDCVCACSYTTTERTADADG